MSLGETIYKLRTKYNLSQGDLADKLSVSRQSVSKWENNTSVPDLDKIIKLSEIFDVSLDELVKGTNSAAEIKEVSKKSIFPPRKIAGTLLFCMAFIIALAFLLLGSGIGGIILAVPFVICGIICFMFQKNAGLWCAWISYLLLDIYLVYASGISSSSVLLSMIWTYKMNYMLLAVAWMLLIGLIFVIAFTVTCFGKEPFESPNVGYKRLIISWTSVILLQVITTVLGHYRVHLYVYKNLIELYALYSLISVLLTWGKIFVITIALTATVRYIKTKMK